MMSDTGVKLAHSSDGFSSFERSCITNVCSTTSTILLVNSVLKYSDRPVRPNVSSAIWETVVFSSFARSSSRTTIARYIPIACSIFSTIDKASSRVMQSSDDLTQEGKSGDSMTMGLETGYCQVAMSRGGILVWKAT